MECESWFATTLVVSESSTELGSCKLKTARLAAAPAYTHLSKKVASRRRSRTLCLIPAHRWQFISWPRVMNTCVPGGGKKTNKRICWENWSVAIKFLPLKTRRRRQFCRWPNYQFVFKELFNGPKQSFSCPMWKAIKTAKTIGLLYSFCFLF